MKSIVQEVYPVSDTVVVWHLLVVIVTFPVDKIKTVVMILRQNVLVNMNQEVHVFFLFLKKLKKFSLFQTPEKCLKLWVTPALGFKTLRD